MASSPAPPEDDITTLLHRWSEEGDRESLDRLMPLVLQELHRMASGFFRQERASHTLQPTALVHEVYLRLVDRRQATWEDRVHFLSFAARTMRRVLVDHSRRHQAKKRGADARRVPLTEASAIVSQQSTELLALHEALCRLAEVDERQARMVELRYFGGLTVEETATVVGLSPATVKRDLAMARAWLQRALAG